MTPPRIRPIALCVFRREQSILVYEGRDTVTGLRFYRPLGGGIEPSETSRAAVAREIKEELSLEAHDFELLGVLENIFTLDGLPKHEIVFVYDGRFADESVYTREELHGVEANGEPLFAAWRPLVWFDKERRLVPEGLEELLRGE